MKLLYQYFPTMKSAWQAPLFELRRAGLYQRDAEKINAQRQTIDLDTTMDILKKNDIKTLTISDADYPRLLKEIYDPPALLYYRGQLPTSNSIALAVVGARKTSPYGRQTATQITTALARRGITIVSGLALGIDALAHQAAVDTGVCTIAVLACGLDRIYPVSNHALGEAIVASGGTLLSEYPPGTPPLKQHFPVRNRIISGLARGVVVIEGTKDSGSLITARRALDQNREVFAVPGNISSINSDGPNQLLKLGAALVTDVADIFNVLNLDNVSEKVHNRKILPTTEAEAVVLDHLTTEPLHIDEIFQKSKLNTSIINTALTTLEMKGFITHIGGAQYVRNE